jgi:Phosphoesterase family
VAYWQTMPEALLAAGVSWKVYNDPLALLALSPLPYFKAYNDPLSLTGIELIAKALTPTYPGDFKADVASGSLPAVSWIMSPLAECEHPAAPPEYGEYLVHQVLATLVSNPQVRAHTVLFVVYDENGGFFDHVPPPTAPAGTAGEYLTTLPLAAGGIAGPIGLGFRTPCLVISPFSRGGYLYSGVLDPHLAAALHRDPLRRARAQPVRLAARRDGRHDRGAGTRQAAEHPCPRAAQDIARQHQDRRRGGAQRPGRHPRRRHPLPAADQEPHARPGGDPGAPPGALLTRNPPRRGAGPGMIMAIWPFDGPDRHDHVAGLGHLAASVPGWSRFGHESGWALPGAGTWP